MKTRYLLLAIFLPIACGLKSQSVQLDRFESTKGWDFIKSDGVSTTMSLDQGVEGQAIRFDYDFTKGTGYGGIQKWFAIDIPENYEFTFMLKASSPANNFEIKLIDSSGNNVWWVSNRNYTFPEEWKKIRIKKRHISFAWGPIADQQLRRVDRIEFTVASYVGGKGSVWIDDLRFEALDPEPETYPDPTFKADSEAASHPVHHLFDKQPQSWWQSGNQGQSELLIDFKTRRSFGGLQIHWQEGMQAQDYQVLLSDDGKLWEKAYQVQDQSNMVSWIRLAEAEARYLRLQLSNPADDSGGIGIKEIDFLTVKQTLTMNDFLISVAKQSPTGTYPRYFLEQASYWTISGVNNDVKEAMLSEDGMVEVDKASFSVEPMLRVGGKLFHWANVKTEQRLGEDASGTNQLDFVPAVDWLLDDLRFSTSLITSGEANQNSQLNILYDIENKTDRAIDLELFLLIRPFQVNPYYQFLNLAGGVGKIDYIRKETPTSLSVDSKKVYSQRAIDQFTAISFDQQGPVDWIEGKSTRMQNEVTDKQGLASAVMGYHIQLQPAATEKLVIVVPFHSDSAQSNLFDEAALEAQRAFWQSKTGHVQFKLPPSADRLVDTYRSNLAYILINRDKTGIQPGSRSYERSWIRDGALTSSALLKSGIAPEVKDFIRWYAAHQYENGKVPCVVDFRGPDPVPENDSHGQFIYLLREYFNFTHDTAFLREYNPAVLKAVEYIETLVNERSTDHFKYGSDSVRAYYGLVPESISHEGYSAKPMHSYWDNFFTIKGLKDAADIQHILGESVKQKYVEGLRDAFTTNLYSSINLAMKQRQIDYIPGCVELGDFDATSTTVALTPCNELNNLPKPQVYNTFEKYYTFFTNRRDGLIDWVNYTPYENRLIGSFIFLDQPDRAHELIDYFLNDQRPHGWNHWAEVVWKDERTPRYIGDMPHTWVGSDFINAFRSMFVYENEYDSTLVVGAALYQDWIDAPDGMSVKNLPTYYGELSYDIQRKGDTYVIRLRGDLDLPANGIRIRNFNRSRLPEKVTINGKESKQFSSKVIEVSTLPADIVIKY